MINISRESEINLINILIDQDIISGKDLVEIKKISGEGEKSQLDAVFELNLTDEEKDSVEASTVKLEEAIKQDSLEAIEEATKNLNEILTPLTQKLYPQAEAGSPDSTEEASSDENTVDAEFEEVKEEEK